MRTYVVTSWSGTSQTIDAARACLAARVVFGPGATVTERSIVLDAWGEPVGTIARK